MGPTDTRPVQDPLAVVLLYNELYMLSEDNVTLLCANSTKLGSRKTTYIDRVWLTNFILKTSSK